MVVLGVFWVGLISDSQGGNLPGRLRQKQNQNISYQPGWEESHLSKQQNLTKHDEFQTIIESLLHGPYEFYQTLCLHYGERLVAAGTGFHFKCVCRGEEIDRIYLSSGETTFKKSMPQCHFIHMSKARKDDLLSQVSIWLCPD